MDPNIVCPVCTLYLRPGMTLKSHLATHPKHKVIEALVKFTLEGEEAQKQQDALNSANTSAGSSQVNTIVNHQSWNHGNSPNVPPNAAPMQGNHVFIYQQSMSTTSPQGNVLNIHNPLSQQYSVIPAVFNTQMMPYVYQQQQVIMSSNACVPPPLRALPLDLPPSGTDVQTAIITEALSNDEESSNVLDKEGKKEESIIECEPENITDEADEVKTSKEKDLKSGVHLSDDDYDEDCDLEYEDYGTELEEGSKSPQETSWDQQQFSADLNKACQTQTSTSLPPDNQTSQDYLYLEQNSTYAANAAAAAFEQSDPIYTSTNILQSNDYIEMDGMQVIINDFSTTPLISHVENFESTRPDGSSDLMTIGDMVPPKADFTDDQRDFEESVSRESSNVNIRTDECMPPRGELSGQESIGGVSDITWGRRVHYQDGNSAMSASARSDDLMARETWEVSNSSSTNFQNEIHNAVADGEPHLNFKYDNPCEQEELPDTKLEILPTEIEPPGKVKKINLIGADIGKKKVKKIVVKPKATIVKENNFDNVFGGNKLKLEEPTADDPIIEEDLKIICSICDCVVEDIKAHKLEVHNVGVEVRHKCGTCGEGFQNLFKYTEHLHVHPLECRLCAKLFYRRQNLILHMNRHLGLKPYKCETCGKCFVTKQKHDEHKNTHTGEAPIKCTMCPETFRRHSNLIQHRNRHHFRVKKKLKDYICHCGEVFHSKKKLAWHKEIHDDKPKACTKCSEKFVHMASLTRHMRRAHNETFLPNKDRESENVECPICKGIYLRSSLEVHIRNHSGQRPHTCKMCRKDFTTKWNLKLHEWTHASPNTKPYRCDQCKGAFIRESDYVAHMNSHKSIRPYTCNYCGAQFIRKSNCQRHVKEHESNKTFNCHICNKSFHRSYYLKDHLRIHSGVRPYSCHICGKTSATKSNHNKHVQIHHAREPVNTEN